MKPEEKLKYAKIESVGELLRSIASKKEVYYEVSGQMYKLNAVRILQTPFGEVLGNLKQGYLFHIK